MGLTDNWLNQNFRGRGARSVNPGMIVRRLAPPLMDVYQDSPLIACFREKISPLRLSLERAEISHQEAAEEAWRAVKKHFPNPRGAGFPLRNRRIAALQLVLKYLGIATDKKAGRDGVSFLTATPPFGTALNMDLRLSRPWGVIDFERLPREMRAFLGAADQRTIEGLLAEYGLLLKTDEGRGEKFDEEERKVVDRNIAILVQTLQRRTFPAGKPSHGRPTLTTPLAADAGGKKTYDGGRTAYSRSLLPVSVDFMRMMRVDLRGYCQGDKVKYAIERCDAFDAALVAEALIAALRVKVPSAVELSEEQRGNLQRLVDNFFASVPKTRYEDKINLKIRFWDLHGIAQVLGPNLSQILEDYYRHFLGPDEDDLLELGPQIRRILEELGEEECRPAIVPDRQLP